jgi:hypothetical protein
MEVSSPPGGGTTFSFSVPVATRTRAMPVRAKVLQ